MCFKKVQLSIFPERIFLEKKVCSICGSMNKRGSSQYLRDSVPTTIKPLTQATFSH